MAEAEDVQSVFKVLAIPVDMPVILQPVCDSEDNDEKQNVYANNNMLTDKTDAGIDESEPPSATTYYLKCQPEHVDGVEVSNFYHQVRLLLLINIYLWSILCNYHNYNGTSMFQF